MKFRAWDHDGSEVIDDPIEVHRRLLDIGITEEEIHQIARAGLTALFGCTRNHPRMAGGFYQWAEMVCTAGDLKGKDGWSRLDYKNFSTVQRADGRVAIAIVRGDEGTGNSTADVSTKYPRGPATVDVVRSNRLNLNLPLDERYVAENAERGKSRSDLATYLLLHARQGDQWRFELSLPRSINQQRFVEEWQVRLILPSIDLEPVPSRGSKPVIPNVSVKRRRAG